MAIEGLSVRLLLDHHVDPRIAGDLRGHGFDVTFPRELGTERASDEDHLVWATEQRRAVFTYDIGDFRRIAERWADEGRDHAGINFSMAPPRITYGELLSRLLALLDSITADEMVNQVRWI